MNLNLERFVVLFPQEDVKQVFYRQSSRFILFYILQSRVEGQSWASLIICYEFQVFICPMQVNTGSTVR